MKKLFLIIVSVLSFSSVSASNVEKIQFANAGDFSLGLMVGIPPVGASGTPFFSVDGMVGLKDGFIHTKKFGENGAIDLGLLTGVQVYNHSNNFDIPIVARGGFHFEFIKNFDVYAGFLGGVQIAHWCYEPEFFGPEDRGTEQKGTKGYGVFGNYLGAKWHFTKFFGVKVEFAEDYIGQFHYGKNYVHRHDRSAMPFFSGGVSFNF
ncbi:MAG: hypothetical protein IK017_12820 [Paludibacteraceae bacterium]|nr:hypothetical protein [Paludibacteraceae bacterium]